MKNTLQVELIPRNSLEFFRFTAFQGKLLVLWVGIYRNSSEFPVQIYWENLHLLFQGILGKKFVGVQKSTLQGYIHTISKMHVSFCLHAWWGTLPVKKGWTKNSPANRKIS